MKYTTKWCPHCGKTITFMDSTKHQYGSPFRTCPKCNKVYTDTSFIELACTTEHVDDIPKVTGVSIFGIIFSSFFLIMAFVLGLSDAYGTLFLVAGLVFLFLSIYLVYEDVKTYHHRVETFTTEMKESEARMSDPEYIRALLKIGYFVPPAYINSAKKKIAVSNTARSAEAEL